MKRFYEKLKSTAGFTLAEQVMSIVFIGLLCLAISAGIGAAMTVHNTVSDEANAEQLLSRTMNEVSGELSFSIAVDGSTFESATTRSMVEFENDVGGIALKDTHTGSSSLVIPGSNGLMPEFDQLPVYDSTSNTWSYGIIITKDGTTLASQTMTVLRNTTT